MSESWANASHGKAVTHQRSEPSAERSRKRSVTGRTAPCRSAMRAGSMPARSRVFQSAWTLMVASIALISSSEYGGSHPS